MGIEGKDSGGREEVGKMTWGGSAYGLRVFGEGGSLLAGGEGEVVCFGEPPPDSDGRERPKP